MATILEPALIELLTKPTSYVPQSDTTRYEAATALQELAPMVSIASKPQGSSEVFAITLEKKAGQTFKNTDSFPRIRWPMVDFLTWCRLDDPRARLSDLISLNENMRIILDGFGGTVSDVEICRISEESDPVQIDEQPRNASDGWAISYISPYLVQWVADQPTLRILS